MGEELKETLLNKKIDSYSYNLNDFEASNEIMVRITLAEYRYLIREVARKEQDIKEANKDKYERDSENKKLKTENEKLFKELFEYKNCFGELLKEEEKNEDISD